MTQSRSDCQTSSYEGVRGGGGSGGAGAVHDSLGGGVLGGVVLTTFKVFGKVISSTVSSV